MNDRIGNAAILHYVKRIQHRGVPIYGLDKMEHLLHLVEPIDSYPSIKFLSMSKS